MEETVRRYGAFDVTWGDVHRVRIGDTDEPVGGCIGAMGCFRVLNFRTDPDGKRSVTGGDGWVLAVEFGREVPRAYSVLAYGNTNREDSPHRGDQAAMFARGEMKRVLFLPTEIDAGAVARYRPGAAYQGTQTGTAGRERGGVVQTTGHAGLAEIASMLARGELRSALAKLNARTNLRFTGVYRFEPPLLRSVVLFDRENPTLPLGGDAAPLDDTFCSIVRATGSPQLIDNVEARAEHAARAERSGVLAYCGVPLMESNGEAFGTLCHFDLRPRITPAAEIDALVHLAPAVMRAVEAAGLTDAAREASRDSAAR